MSSLITEQFFNPANVGAIEQPDGVGVNASLICGAALRISLRVADSKIIDAKFKCSGCSYLVTACSFITELAKGKTTGEAAALLQKPNQQALVAGWPAEKNQCLELASQGLLIAIRNYSDAARAEWSGDEALICTCFGVSERVIENVIESGGLRTIAEVTKASNAGAGCQSCHPLIEEILDQFAHDERLRASVAPTA